MNRHRPKEPLSLAMPFVVLVSLSGAAGVASQVQQAEVLVPILLLLAVGVIGAAYAITRTLSQADNPPAEPTFRRDKTQMIDSMQQEELGLKLTDSGIGTGVVKIFQQIKDNLADVKTLTEGYHHLLSLSCQQLGFDAGGAFVVDKDGDMKLRGSAGFSRELDETCVLLPSPLVNEAFEIGFPRFTTNVGDIRLSLKAALESYRAAWLLPIMPQGEPAGIIIFLMKEGPAQVENLFPKLDFVGIAASWFYENHHNQVLIAKENKRNEVLVKTSLEISSSLDLDEICNTLVTRLGKYAGCSYSFILVNLDGGHKMYMQKFYSEREKSEFVPHNRTINVESMSWLQEIIASGNPVLLYAVDLALYPEADLQSLYMGGSTSTLIAPLKHAGKVIGTLFMVEERSAERSGLNKEIVDLTAALVAQASAAIDNARMYLTISDKVAQLATMFDVGQALNSDLDLMPFLERVLRAVAKNFGILNCAFLLRDFATDELCVVSILGEYSKSQLGRRLKIGREGITGHAAALGKPINVGDVTIDRRFIVSTGGTGSELAVPVVLDGKVVGILDVESERKYAFSQREEDLLKSLMDQVAAAIEKIKLKQQERERAAKLALTNTLVKKLASILDRAELLGEAVRDLAGGFGFDLVAIFTPDRDGRFVLTQQSCRIGNGFEPVYRIEPGMGILGRVLTEMKSALVPTGSPGEHLASSDCDVAIAGIESRFCLPLMAGGKLHGILDIQDRRAQAFSQIDISMLQTIAEFLAVTLNNRSLYLEITDKAERLSLVDQTTQAISATLEPEELFGKIVKSLSEITGYRWATLIFKDNESYRTTSEYFKGYRGGPQEMPTVSSMAKYFEDVIAESKPVYYSIESLKLDGPLQQYFRSQEINYMAISPLKRENKTVGFLLVGNPNPEGFRPQDYSLLYDLSQHMEVALSNAMLYSELKEAYHRLAETQENLIQIEKFKALGEIAAGIAHDFKNILAAIVGRVQLLAHAKKQNKEISERMLAKSLEIIEKSAMDGINILSRINEFTKSKQETQFTVVHINEVIEDTIEMTRTRWECPQSGRRIDVVTNLQGGLVINGNRAEMIEVATNLILNAIDAIEKEGVITIESFIADDHVVLRFGDNGIGMDAKTLKRIFDPYFTTKGRLGTGLGLAMVYAIVDRHNGEISVQSTPGAGSMFTIKLPRLPEVALKPGGAVLIVEENETFRNVLKEVLKDIFDAVHSVGSYSEASSILTSEPISLVLVDLGLPDRQCWKVIDLARSVTPDMQVVPMADWDQDMCQEEVATRGFTTILRKPFSIQQVRDLAEMITERKADAERVV